VPCILLIGGETTVTITGEHGEGGRNQELALAAALKIAGSKRIVIASVGRDGTDGPTDIPGAIVEPRDLLMRYTQVTLERTRWTLWSSMWESRKAVSKHRSAISRRFV